MKNYFQKSMRALQACLSEKRRSPPIGVGMSERTQECYTRAVRQFVDFYKKNTRPNLRTSTTGLFPPP
jgi:hypothetical protein